MTCQIDHSSEISGAVSPDSFDQSHAWEWVELVIFHSTDESFKERLEAVLSCIDEPRKLRQYDWKVLRQLAELAVPEQVVAQTTPSRQAEIVSRIDTFINRIYRERN